MVAYLIWVVLSANKWDIVDLKWLQIGLRYEEKKEWRIVHFCAHVFSWLSSFIFMCCYISEYPQISYVAFTYSLCLYSIIMYQIVIIYSHSIPRVVAPNQAFNVVLYIVGNLALIHTFTLIPYSHWCSSKKYTALVIRWSKFLVSVENCVPWTVVKFCSNIIMQNGWLVLYHWPTNFFSNIILSILERKLLNRVLPCW